MNHREAYLNKVMVANSHLFAGKKIQMTPNALKQAIRSAFDAGYTSGKQSKSLWETVFGEKASHPTERIYG